MTLNWPDLIFPPINLYSMARNDITGDKLVSKKSTKDYRDNYDKIFHRGEAESKFEKVVIGGITKHKLKVQ